MIGPEVAAEIVRLFAAEKWPIGTIASQLGVHHSVVRRVLATAGLPRTARPRPSRVDSYLGWIVETWTRYPKLTARRLYDMACERGYRGSPDHFRHRVAHLRPRPPAEAYLRLATLPGEQAQVDWGHFGRLEIGRARRPLMAFVMVLSWSRAVFLRFYPAATTACFLRGHVAAFEAFGGVARRALYDNLKSAVCERRGDAIVFNRTLLAFSAHYRYEPRPVAIARGNEKGRVERAIRYVRDSFFAARRFRDVQDLNAQAQAWCEGTAGDRPWPDDPTTCVRDALVRERASLLALPDEPYPVLERVEVSVGKTPYVRFDGNDYSVPHTLVRTTLVVFADEERMRVCRGDQVVAEHARCYDRRRRIEDPRHVRDLLEEKRRARLHHGTGRLEHAVPATRALLVRMAERSLPVGRAVKTLLGLLDTFGAAELAQAVDEALSGGAPHPDAVRHVLERRRETKGQPPALEPHLPQDPRVRDLAVRPHPLHPYDALPGDPNHEDEDEDRLPGS